MPELATTDLRRRPHIAMPLSYNHHQLVLPVRLLLGGLAARCRQGWPWVACDCGFARRCKSGLDVCTVAKDPAKKSMMI